MNRIYISGPITGTDDFYERFAEAEATWSCDGSSVVNPAKLNDIMPKDATHEEYMRMSFELLDICDAIYMMKGWEESKGANREYGYAVAKGMRLMFEKWSEEHPPETRLARLLKNYPNTLLKAEGIPDYICAAHLGLMDIDDCIDDCVSCWNTPIEEEGGVNV